MALTNVFRTDGWVKAVNGYAVPGAQIYVCLQPANTASLPPTPLANIFSDVNGLVPITQPIITDGFGHYNFYAAAGVYTVVVGLNGVIQQIYPDQSVGGASGTTGGGGGTALVLQVNGTSTVNQLLANFIGSGNTTVTDDGSGGIVINSIAPSFSTANFGYLWSFSGLTEAGGTIGAGTSLTRGSDGGSAVANQVICFQISLKVAYTFRKVSFFESGAVSGHASCAIYNSTGTIKLVDAGVNAFDNSNVATMQTVTFGSPTTLQPGVYWFACSSTSNSSASSNGSTLTSGPAGYSAFFNSNTVRGGIATNPMSGGAMPSSLGTITAFTAGNFGCPGFFFQV